MLKTALLILLLLLALNLFYYWQQPNMVFFPVKAFDGTPTDWARPYQDVHLTTRDDIKLHGWFFPNTSAGKTLLFFHGNAGNISHRRQSIEIFLSLGLNVFIVDYRGYGQSQGAPDERGLYLDAAAAYDYLVKTRGIAAKDIIVFGRSLGGVIASHLVADMGQKPPSALIVESSFSSAQDMAHRIIPGLAYVIYSRFRFNAWKTIQKANCPVLVLHSPEDEIIPFELGEKLYRAAPEPKQLVLMRGDHNNGFLLSQPEYQQALKSFMERL